MSIFDLPKIRWTNLFLMDLTMPARLLLSFAFLLIPIVCQAQLPNPDYYALFQVTGGSGETRLIDSAGTVLHSWETDLFAASGTTAYLREDGLLLRSGQRRDLPTGGFLPGSWSTVQLVEPDGTVVWDYTLQVSGELTLHHDIKPMRNGNVLVNVWELVPAAELEALGWQRVNGVNGVWMEKIQELEPNLVDGSTNVVWEWALENHLSQDLDVNRANFADVGEERGRVDINFNAGIFSGDYFHISGIDYSEERDEIVLCPNNIDELWVIDHSTTTAEAATSTGGARGQGGELIYRWGNPRVYDFHNGASEQSFLRGAHDPRWSVDPQSGEIQLTVHNNDRVDATPGDSESQVLLLNLPLNASGDYVISSAETFLPSVPVVLYEQDPANPFFRTPFMGGAQRLSNGNILITLALSRTLVEVNEVGEIVWRETTNADGNFIFKAQAYRVSYAGFQSLPFNTPLKGDVNLDDVVNFDDISPFIIILAAGGFQAEADTNGDGEVDFSDIAPFIRILSLP
ncbi:aryl-sulfate sulfotransferase [Mariniblastus sp.]|nr:aryl-sulfate sulfotransferase [Mariniblastus sp.]